MSQESSREGRGFSAPPPPQLEDLVSQGWVLPSPTLLWCPFWALCQSQCLAHDCVSLWGDVSKSRVPRGSNYVRWQPTPITNPLGEGLCRALLTSGLESAGWAPVLPLQPPLCSSPHAVPTWVVLSKVSWGLGGGRLRIPSPNRHRFPQQLLPSCTHPFHLGTPVLTCKVRAVTATSQQRPEGQGPLSCLKGEAGSVRSLVITCLCEHLLCSSHCSRHFSSHASLWRHTNPMREVLLLAPFYRQGHRVQRWSLPYFMQLVNGRAV